MGIFQFDTNVFKAPIWLYKYSFEVNKHCFIKSIHGFISYGRIWVIQKAYIYVYCFQDRNFEINIKEYLLYLQHSAAIIFSLFFFTKHK